MASIGKTEPRVAAHHGPRATLGAARRLHWKPEFLQVIEYTIIATVYLYHLLGPDGGRRRGWGDAALWTSVMAGFTLWPLLKDRVVARGWAVPYVAGRLLLCAWALWLARVGFIPTFLCFLVVSEAIALDRRIGVRTGIATALALYGEMFLLVGASDPEAYIRLLPWLAGLIFVGGTTMLNVREQAARVRSDALLIELTAAHRQLQHQTAQAEELATTRERNRLAREIHDSLGHYLTVIAVQLESAQALRPRDPARADRAVGEAKRLASEALADVRRSVAALQPTALDELPVAAAIGRQVAEFRAHSGLPVALAIEGEERRCSRAAGLALYRAVQEGLTNIRKHAGATAAAVTLRFGPAATELTIRDNGRGLPGGHAAGPRPDGGGFGLAGLRERLALLGGALAIGPAPTGGAELRVTIPATGEEREGWGEG